MLRLGKSFAIVGIRDSLVLVGVTAAEFSTVVGTRSFKLQPSKSNSSKHGKNPTQLSGRLGRSKDLSLRLLERMRTFNVFANGCATIVDKGNVGVGIARSSVRDVDEVLDGKGVATEKARAWPTFEGGADAGRRSI